MSPSSLSIWSLLLVSLTLMCSCGAISKHENIPEDNIHLLKPGVNININGSAELNIFCRKGELKKLANYFLSATLRIESTAEDIQLIRGYNAQDVNDQYVHRTKWLLWAANLLPWRVREATFPTFNSSCVGISTRKNYTAVLVIRYVDKWNFLILMAGLALFILAPKLTKSTIFFYTSGTLLGALAVVLILLFFITRFLPKGRSGYVAMSFVWTVCLYFAGEMWNHFDEFIHERLPYVLVYLSCGALLALILCYRLGPPTNPKTLDIIQWTLQACGLVLIHLSSDLVEVSTAIIAITVVVYLTHSRITYFVQRNWRRRFPPSVKLLTEEEYITQGARETEKGLEELRKFCSSPDCDSWKLVSRLKNPLRFSSFMQGDSHLSDEEMMDYESEVSSDENGLQPNDFYTDDDDSISINGNGTSGIQTEDEED